MPHVLLAVLALVVVLAAPPTTAAPCDGFTDVEDTSPFCVNVAWMRNRGITLGCAATLYCPNDFVTRLQMAAFMYRLGFQNAHLQGGNAFGATSVLGTTDNQALDMRVNSSRVMRYEPNAVSPNVIGGSPANSVTAGVRGATIAGGGVPTGDTDPDFASEAPNRVTDAYGTVGGGYGNRAGDDAGTTIDRTFATVGGGRSNTASGAESTVGGGHLNTTSGLASTVGGGFFNTASGFLDTVGGGELNTASGNRSTVGGGDSNTASGQYSTVGGGLLNTASGDYSSAAGRRAKASYQGAFLWADSTDLDFRVQANEVVGGWNNAANTFNVRATGGVWLVTAVEAGTGRPTAGAWLGAGGSAWNVTSDAASKVDVHAIDPQEVLAKALTVEVSRWRYRTAPGIEHIGPMAQDFHRAFSVGSDERSIATVDADGVALAAIQGLNAKLEAKLAEHARENAKQVRDLAAQQAQIAELKRLVAQLLARP